MKTIKKFLNTAVNKETILYIVFGILTTIINIVASTLCYQNLPVSSPELLDMSANCVGWILAVLFAFITNKLFVFESRNKKGTAVLTELLLFVAARLFSLGMELFFMYLLVDLFHRDYVWSKILMNVVVVILNYLFSKLFIFKKDSNETTEET